MKPTKPAAQGLVASCGRGRPPETVPVNRVVEPPHIAALIGPALSATHVSLLSLIRSPFGERPPITARIAAASPAQRPAQVSNARATFSATRGVPRSRPITMPWSMTCDTPAVRASARMVQGARRMARADYGVKTHGVYITSPIPYPPALFEVGGLFEKCPTDGSIPRPGTRRTAAFSSFGHAILNATSATTWTGTVTAQPVPRLRRGTRLLECSGSGIRRARLIRCVERIGPTVTMPRAYGVAVSRARGRGVAVCLGRGSIHPPPLFVERGGVARERLVWWERTSSGAAQLRHNGPRSADVTGSCNWTADYQTAVRSGKHPDFLDFANRQPAATVSSGCQGPIIRLQRQIGDTCGRTRAKATPGKRKRQPTAGSLHRIRRRSSCR